MSGGPEPPVVFVHVESGLVLTPLHPGAVRRTTLIWCHAPTAVMVAGRGWVDLVSWAATLRRVKIAEARNGDLAIAMPGFRRTFDRLFERGLSAVLSGCHYRDSPPVEGGRWGLSVVLRPDGVACERLASLTDQAMERAAKACGPIRLRLGGLTLTPSGVMLCAYPMDSARPDRCDWDAIAERDLSRSNRADRIG